MPDKKPSALSGEQKPASAVSISVAVSSLAGIAFSALTAVSCFAADGSALPLKSISLDAQKQLIVEFSTHGGGFPAVPHLLDLPGPNHRVVVDLAGAIIEKGSLQTQEELSTAIGKAIPAIKGLRYYNQTNTDKPTARIVLDLPEALRAEPRVVKLDENSVTIDLGSEITSANVAGSIASAAASTETAPGAQTTAVIPVEGSPMAQALAASPAEGAKVSAIADTASAPTPFAAAEPTPVSSASPAVGQDTASAATAAVAPGAAATAAVATATADTTDGIVHLKQPETIVTNSPAGTAPAHEDWSLNAERPAIEGKNPAAMQPPAAPVIAAVSQTGDTVDGIAQGAATPQRTVAQPAAAGDSPQLRPAIGGGAPAAPDQPLGSSPTGNAITPPSPLEASPTGVKAAVKLYNSAVKNHLAGKLADAINDYKGAIAANPQLAEAHSNLGLIFNQQHNYTQALSEFRKALAINPKDAITYNGIGAALRAQKDLPGAIKNWQTAVTLDPQLATAHYNLGTAYEIQKDYDRALESYKEAVKNDYRLGEAYYRMGLIQQERKHQNAEALSQFREALKASTDSEYSDDARSRVALLGKSRQTATK
jgi:Tfp pilus assembly protein PilF